MQKPIIAYNEVNGTNEPRRKKCTRKEKKKNDEEMESYLKSPVRVKSFSDVFFLLFFGCFFFGNIIRIWADKQEFLFGWFNFFFWFCPHVCSVCVREASNFENDISAHKCTMPHRAGKIPYPSLYIWVPYRAFFFSDSVAHRGKSSERCKMEIE